MLGQVRKVIQFKHYSSHTGESYITWIKRYILLNNKWRPQEMGNKV
ncbi:MAG: phage integrase N-terminal SAM-like domain-containing protein [Thermodesulfobacteriota bacterium]